MKYATSLITCSSGTAVDDCNPFLYPPVVTLLRSYCEKKRLSQSRLGCLECGYIENADINGGRNILAVVLAGGGMVSSGFWMSKRYIEFHLNQWLVPWGAVEKNDFRLPIR